MSCTTRLSFFYARIAAARERSAATGERAAGSPEGDAPVCRSGRVAKDGKAIVDG
jgi:hypothetical protein